MFIPQRNSKEIKRISKQNKHGIIDVAKLKVSDRQQFLRFHHLIKSVFLIHVGALYQRLWPPTYSSSFEVCFEGIKITALRRCICTQVGFAGQGQCLNAVQIYPNLKMETGNIACYVSWFVSMCQSMYDYVF